MTFLVLGEALVDLVQSRADGRFAAHPGGSPYNVAITLGRLGQRVAFAGRCGADGFGRQLTAHLQEAGVDLSRWATMSLPTSLAVAALDAGGSADYGFYFAQTAGLSLSDAVGPEPVAVLHTGSIASWLAPSAAGVQQAMRAARDGGETLVSYDPNARPALMPDLAAGRTEIERCIALAHVVKASDDDLALLYGAESVERVAARWCESGPDLVVVTRGAAGAVAFGPGGVVAECPAPPVQVVDTVGAGDSFTGGLLAALAESGLATPGAVRIASERETGNLTTAVATAVMVSAMTCERAGADPPTKAELARRLGAQSSAV